MIDIHLAMIDGHCWREFWLMDSTSDGRVDSLHTGLEEVNKFNFHDHDHHHHHHHQRDHHHHQHHYHHLAVFRGEKAS